MIGWMFRTPTGFEHDPRGFVLNQAGHAVIVGAGSGGWALLWEAQTGLRAWPVVALTLTLYALWEASQYAAHDAAPWDCVEDFAFVATGALAVLLLSPMLAGTGVLFLLSGWMRRRASSRLQ